MNKYGMSLIIPFSRTMMLTCPFLASDSFLSSSGSHNSLFLYITAAIKKFLLFERDIKGRSTTNHQRERATREREKRPRRKGTTTEDAPSERIEFLVERS